MSRGPTRRADSYFRALRYSAGRFATPGGPRSTLSGARRYSGGRSEPRSDPAGVRARKPWSPPVSESRPGGTAYAAHAVFQCAQNANPASSPPADSRCCPKTGGEGAEARLEIRRRRTAASAARRFRHVPGPAPPIQARGPGFQVSRFPERGVSRYGNLPEPRGFQFIFEAESRN
jgi:hypothetical protein